MPNKETTEKTRYCIVSDDDGHYYVIPVNRFEEWDEWVYKTVPYSIERGCTPEWADSVGGCQSPVNFPSYEVEGR